MSISQVLVTVLDALSAARIVRADQNSADQSIAFHSVIEQGGVSVSGANPFAVSDATLAGTQTSMLGQITTTSTTLGSVSDTPWSGTGSASLASVMKAIWTSVSGTMKFVQPDIRASATTLALATQSATYIVAVQNGQSVVGFTVANLTSSNATLIVEVSSDGGTTWATANAVLNGTSTFVQSMTQDGTIRVSVGGHTNARLRVLVTGTGSASISSSASVAGSIVALAGPVVHAGSTGTDRSINAPSIPMAGYTLVTTIVSNPNRLFVEVQNQSANTIQVVRDDGNGNNQTTILLSSSGTAGQQGSGWTSSTFRGRIRIYAISKETNPQISAYED